MTNSIKNNPITKGDVEMMIEMLSLSKYAAQGKTIRKQSNAVDIMQKVEVPQ